MQYGECRQGAVLLWVWAQARFKIEPVIHLGRGLMGQRYTISRRRLIILWLATLYVLLPTTAAIVVSSFSGPQLPDIQATIVSSTHTATTAIAVIKDVTETVPVKPSISPNMLGTETTPVEPITEVQRRDPQATIQAAVAATTQAQQEATAQAQATIQFQQDTQATTQAAVAATTQAQQEATAQAQATIQSQGEHQRTGCSWPSYSRNNPINSAQDVATIQYLLRARNYPIRVDGLFGEETEAAVKEFQRSVGLTSDGIVGPDTWQSLIIRVRINSRGDAVQAVQELLANRYGYPLTIDAIFGCETENIVRNFQLSKGLAVDGIVGPDTLCSLIAEPTQ
jgi:peptidoglycan hydrolase-like protein with peptidoglycan-binding domain